MFKVGICDDEKSTCAELEKLLLICEFKNKTKFDIQIWYSGEILCQYLNKINDLDLIFLDIQLYKLSGLDVGKFIRNELDNMKTSIVFISHERGYAMELFKFQPLDFLLKPINREEIESVIQVFLKIKNNRNIYFEYKKNNIFYKVPYNEIIYFASSNRKMVQGLVQQ